LHLLGRSRPQIVYPDLLANAASKTGRSCIRTPPGNASWGPEAGTYLRREYREPWKLDLP
ncbi:MAG: hypothetical protein L0312_16775, partial [Acidobacteria bacterium]|nr:hypothetical protein [Acidobacteriota bacterium]